MDLRKGFNDSGVYECEKFSGKLFHVSIGEGFNYGYVVFLPNNISKNTTMIVEGANAFMSTDDYGEANRNMINTALSPDLPIYSIANELSMPLLYPLFPRVRNKTETIYNHMLTTNSLKSDTPMLKEYGLERVDLQLINMFYDAKKRLEACGIIIDEKFIIDGFSASGKFANRFTILHPNKVKLCIAGGISGVLTLPLKEFDGEKLLWPVGIGNLNDILGININEEQIEDFKKVRQIYYMGNQDTKNEPFLFNEEGEVKYNGIINKDELLQMHRIFGKHAIDERLPRAKHLYNLLGVNAVFKIYENIGHDPRCATKNVKEEIINILNLGEKIK